MKRSKGKKRGESKVISVYLPAETYNVLSSFIKHTYGDTVTRPKDGAVIRGIIQAFLTNSTSTLTKGD